MEGSNISITIVYLPFSNSFLFRMFLSIIQEDFWGFNKIGIPLMCKCDIVSPHRGYMLKVNEWNMHVCLCVSAKQQYIYTLSTRKNIEHKMIICIKSYWSLSCVVVDFGYKWSVANCTIWKKKSVQLLCSVIIRIFVS